LTVQPASWAQRNRGFFWPTVLILVGIVALLVEAGVVSADRLYRLLDLWPLILVGIGLVMICRRALHGATADLAVVLIVLVAGGGAVAYVAVGPAISDRTQTLDTSDKVGSLNQATLHVDAGAATVTVAGSGALGADLYHAHIEYSGSKPNVSLDRSTGDLQIAQDNSFAFFGSRSLLLDLQISSAVPWNFSVNTGAASDTFNLSSLKVGSMQLSTGTSHDDITLGPPTGVVPISVDGGALSVHLHRPSGAEASAQVSGGAISLNADGQQYHGIGNQSWQSNGYSGAADAYRVDVNGGACTVTVDTGGG
jgi:cell wall-active antibiotic response 4TMS protein YvqF